MPADLVDPQSGADYFTAVGQLIAASKHIPRDADLSAYSSIAPIPYWENLFPDAAQDGLTATQRMAAEFNGHAPDYITPLYNADECCYPACSTLGAFAFFAPQYDTLGMQSTIGRSQYDALQVSLRKRFSEGYQFDVNYTLGYAKDHGSLLESDTTFARLQQRRLHGLPDRLVGSGQAVRQLGLRRPAPAERELDCRPAVRPRPALRQQHERLARRHRRRLVHGGRLPHRPAGSRSPSSTAVSAGRRTGTCRATPSWPRRACCRRTGTTKDVISGYPSPFKDPQAAVDFFRRA